MIHIKIETYDKLGRMSRTGGMLYIHTSVNLLSWLLSNSSFEEKHDMPALCHVFKISLYLDFEMRLSKSLTGTCEFYVTRWVDKTGQEARS